MSHPFPLILHPFSFIFFHVPFILHVFPFMFLSFPFNFLQEVMSSNQSCGYPPITSYRFLGQQCIGSAKGQANMLSVGLLY